MQEIAKIYDPKNTEEKWYQYWMEKRFFHATVDPSRESYTIVIPPPNVTGVLHMGHMLNNTIQDVLVRKARMEGKNACWVPGTDHASIATEAKVVQKLRKEGIKKSDLSRDAFLDHAWEWTYKHGGIILEQLKKLGASCDWDRTTFTLDPHYYDAVIRVFVDFYNKGYIYRSLRMVNWDCEAKTAVSNEEVIYEEEGEKSFLYHITYQIEDSEETLTIATQRPETIMGDTAIAVNPDDERYKHLLGKMAIVPFIGRKIRIIYDDYVEKDFGTGCLKVTPAHDPNDYEIGLRHNLEIIDTINEDGTLNEKCELPEFYGKDRFEVRELMIKKLEAAGILVKKEEFITKIGRSERTNTIIEPKLSLQWFIRMKDISRRALEAVETDEVALHPAKFKNTYRHWMENVKDWCISRQLWWGQRIPAWYLPDGTFVVAENAEKALEEARKTIPSIQPEEMKQDPDVLDTWASSWLWPMEVFRGFSQYDAGTGKISSPSEELRYFYPTAVLVTAPEILFFWVARMIIAGYEYMGDKPFRDVYLTGIVRDKQGRKMSKSLGNSPDPLELIEKYSADGVRTGMLFSSPAGNDLLFDETLCEQGRNFANKIWNAFRLIKSWNIDPSISPSPLHQTAVSWFESKFDQSMVQINDDFTKFRLSDALVGLYKLTWDDFCGWYLEMAKPEYGQPLDQVTYEATIAIFEKVLKVLHPFMPFITEEIWHNLKERKEGESIMLTSWPALSKDPDPANRFEFTGQLVTAIRNVRAEKNIPMKEKIHLYIKTGTQPFDHFYDAILARLAGLSGIEEVKEAPEKTLSCMVGAREFFIPLNENFDVASEMEKINREIAYNQGFLNSVMQKLTNERFVNNAKPEVVAVERSKKEDAEAKIKALEDQLETLKNM